MDVQELTAQQRLARRITELREERGWSKQRLADETEKLGRRVARSYVSRLELADLKRPSADKLTAIAAALGVPVRNLMEVAGLVEEAPPVLSSTSIREAIERALGAQSVLSEHAIERIVREIQRQEVARASH